MSKRQLAITTILCELNDISDEEENDHKYRVLLQERPEKGS